MSLDKPKGESRNLEEYAEHIRELSFTDLEDIALHIDKESYPDRYQAVIDLISEKRLQSSRIEEESRRDKLIPREENSGHPQDHNQLGGKQIAPNRLSSTVIIIIVFLSFIQIVNGLFEVRGSEPSGAFQFLSYIILFSLVGYWFSHDNRKYKIDWVYDMGFFLYLAWPLIILFYLFKTRGRKAFLIILGYMGIIIGTGGIGVLLGTLFFP